MCYRIGIYYDVDTRKQRVTNYVLKFLFRLQLTGSHLGIIHITLFIISTRIAHG